MEVIQRAFQKTDVITLSVDATVFAFFRVDSPHSVRYSDYSFVSGEK